jgi:hypothetical protein
MTYDLAAVIALCRLATEHAARASEHAAAAQEHVEAFRLRAVRS